MCGKKLTNSFSFFKLNGFVSDHDQGYVEIVLKLANRAGVRAVFGLCWGVLATG